MARLRLTPELIEKMSELFTLGCTNTAVHNGVGIHKTTFYRWLDEAEEAQKRIDSDPLLKLGESDLLKIEFKEEIEKAQAIFQSEALKLIKKASMKTWTAAAWLLERRNPEQFALRNRIDAKHEGKLKIEFIDVKAEKRKQKEEKQKKEEEKGGKAQ